MDQIMSILHIHSKKTLSTTAKCVLCKDFSWSWANTKTTGFALQFGTYGRPVVNQFQVDLAIAIVNLYFISSYLNSIIIWRWKHNFAYGTCWVSNFSSTLQCLFFNVCSSKWVDCWPIQTLIRSQLLTNLFRTVSSLVHIYDGANKRRRTLSLQMSTYWNF